MSIETKKLQLVQHILLTMDEKLLDELDRLIHSPGLRSEKDLESSIASGLVDIEKGSTFAHEDVQEYVRKKYGV